MAKSRLVFMLVVSVLLITSLPLQADAQSVEGDLLVLPNTSLALPVGSKIAVRWVSPPLDPKVVEDAHWHSLCFAADSEGMPWIGYQGYSVINPVRQIKFKLPQLYRSFACMENGAFLVTTESDLCFVAPPKTLEISYDGEPTAIYQPIANLPAPDSKLFAGADNSVYLVSPTNGGGSDVYLLQRDKPGIRGYVKVFTSDNEVRAVTGDGNNIFVAVDGVIAKILQKDGTLTKLYANHREYIQSLAYSPGTGLFYSTNNGVGYIGAKGSIRLMTVPDARISLQNGTLYVLLPKSLGVLAFDNIDDLKRFDRTVIEVPAAESKHARITEVRFFEAGKDVPLPDEREFATEFDHDTTRFVYCQLSLENMQHNKQDHKQTAIVELYRAGQDEPIWSESMSFDCKKEYSTMWGWARFGSDEPGTLYPRVYTVKTYLSGALVNESTFTLTGEPDLLEAAGHHDAAAVSKLIKSGADLNATTNAGYTPLMLAVLSDNMEITKLLLDAGVNVNAKASNGETALTIDGGAWGDDTSITQLLLAAGADINAQGKDGGTALHRAAVWDKMDVIKLLLDHGAKTELKDNKGLTPLLRVNLRSSINPESAAKVVELLLANGADHEARDADGNTPLFSAIEGSNIEAVSVLIKHGADVNATGKIYGVTECSVLGYALDKYEIFRTYRADRHKLWEIAALLQENGADLNVSEFADIYFQGIDAILDTRHLARLQEMSEVAARNLQPEDLSLRKANIRGLLNAACRQISEAKDEYGYYSALTLCEEASARARKWGLSASCSEISFNIGLIYLQVGSTDNARKHLKEYLDMAPTGPYAARARELMNQLK